MAFGWIENIKANLIFRMRKVTVYGLVGRSGTGKSFRSKLIAEKHGIELIIDDGLLIRDKRILGGKSAKREDSRFKAVKRAIFEDHDHRMEVVHALENEKFQSILLLGTSEKMIGRMVERLGLPYPDQIIYIEDVATEEEIAQARDSRKREGKHVIPVPVIEVTKDPSHKIIDSIRFFLDSHQSFRWKKKMIEKTIVQPPFTRLGRLSISETALSQMICHCVQEYGQEIEIKKILIDPCKVTPGYRVEVKLAFPYGTTIQDKLSDLQDYIVTHIEKYSGVHIDKLHLTVDHIEWGMKGASK